MKERKFMIRNSKCFTDMIAHIHKQLLRLLPRWETFSRSPAAGLHSQPAVGKEHIHSAQSPALLSVGWKCWFKSGRGTEPSQ